MTLQPPETTSASVHTVAAIGERGLVDRIRARLPAAPPWVVHGVGDDAAVLEPVRGTLDVITTDALVEGIHFERAFGTPRDLGHKALAINLSDLAAMGAAPRAAVLSLALPAEMPVADLDALLDGLIELATQHRVAIVGGNVARSSGPLFIDVTALGAVKRRSALTRAGARPGDHVYVSGTVGAAAAGLRWLQRHGTLGPVDAEMADCVRRYLRPDPRVRLGMLVGRNRAAHAAIDLSDGLGDGVRQLTEPDDLGAIIEASAVPIDPSARRWFEQNGIDPINAALSGGEDYELLLAIAPSPRSRAALVRRLAGRVPVTRIGTITETAGVVLRGADGDTPLPPGYSHF